MELSEVVRDACKVLFGVSVHAGWTYWRERRRERAVEALAARPRLSWDEAFKDDLGGNLAIFGGLGVGVSALWAAVDFWPLFAQRVPHAPLAALALTSSVLLGVALVRLNHVRRTGRAAK